MSIIFHSKIPLWADVCQQIDEILSNHKDWSNIISIPYGLQLQHQIWNAEPLHVVHHVESASGHSFVFHHGVGKKNEIDIWNFSKENQTGKIGNGLQSIHTDLRLSHILFAQKRWIYLAFCSDLTMRVFSAKFHALSTTFVNKTVLSMAYNEFRDEVVTGMAGEIMTWKFPIGQTDPLEPCQVINCSFRPIDWIMSITVDGASKQILARSDVRISMIDLQTYQENRFFEKKSDFSFTTCVLYNPASYFITGDKNGSIRAWSTSLNSFPMVTQFLGHTAQISKLLVHQDEPLLFSSSLDKTIRIWNFDTCVQTYKLETGEEILDMELLGGDLLFYHSHHHLKIWGLNLFHSLFTVLSSRIKKWTRVKSPGYPARVLVHAEDGGVRIVSPVHGSELTTLLPITTINTNIVDMAHDPRQEKIYLVLGTREVLVFESDTNPCCAHQLWVPENPDEGVCSLAMINAEFSLRRNELAFKSGLLFAGHFNGQISLISGKDIYMKETVQAHHGQVTFLRVSASFRDSLDNIGSRDHLISCGTDCTVRIWELMHPEMNRVTIHQKALVKLLQSPRDLAMAGNTLCMAMTDNNVVMCRVKTEKEQGGTRTLNSVKRSYEFLTHFKDEGHTASISGVRNTSITNVVAHSHRRFTKNEYLHNGGKLSCCPTLGLFATSSDDHSVKIWNNDNQLVREMCFDETLCGVCFANSRGDILVGFQSHISLITVINYLPLPYLEMLSKMHLDNDPFEDHVQFDDMLKFWYDPARVPRMPLDPVKRRGLEPPERRKPKKRKKREQVKVPKEEEETMDLFRQRRASRRLSTKVHVMMALRRLSTRTAVRSGRRSVSPKHGLTQSERKSLRKKKTSSRHGARKVGEESGKVYWPCAPDGYIPNSVIRGSIRPRKPPQRLIPQIIRVEAKQLHLVKEEDGLQEEKGDTESKGRGKNLLDLFSWEAHRKRKQEQHDSSSKKRTKAGSSQAKRRVRSRTRLRPQKRQAGDGHLLDMQEEEAFAEENEDVRDHSPTIEHQEREALFEADSVTIATASVKQAPKEGRSPLKIYQQEEEKEYSDEEEDEEQDTEDDEQDELEEEEEWEDELDESPSPDIASEGISAVSLSQTLSSRRKDILEEIINKTWYPDTLEQERSFTPEPQDVLDKMLIALLASNDLRTIQDICLDVLNIQREFGISEEKLIEIQDCLIKRSFSDKAAARQGAIWALGEMNIHREDAYLTVVRRLIDDNKSVRGEAKRVLEKLTGVVDKEGLSKLIIKTGVVHLYLPSGDNAVLMELAERLGVTRFGERRRKKHRTAEDSAKKMSPLGNLRKTMMKTPFKAKLRRPRFKGRERKPNSRKYIPRRRPSILDEPASLANTVRLKKTLKESMLGCKLLQRMETFLIESKTRQSVYLKSHHDTDREEVGPLEIGGIRVENTQDGSFDWWKENIQQSLSSPSISKPEGSSIPQVGSSTFCNRDTGGSMDLVPKNPHYEIPRRYALAPTIFDSGFIDVDVNESGRSSPVFSLPGVLKVMDSVLGLNDRASKLVLLKMRREERVAPKEEKRQDDTVQQLYTFEDLLEVLFHFPVFKEILQRVASEVPMSSKELLLNLQGHLRSPASGIENKSSTVIQGQGLPVRKSQRELKGTKAKLSEYLKDLIQKTKSPSSSPSENVRPLAGHLEKLLSLCVTLKRNEVPSQPLFLHPIIAHRTVPGTYGQRLLHSTFIRARTLSEIRLQSPKETRDFMVSSLPHKLTVDTGIRSEGESRYGILELGWRAGTPLPPSNDDIPCRRRVRSFPRLLGKHVHVKTPFMVNSSGESRNFQPRILNTPSVPLQVHRSLRSFTDHSSLFRAVNGLNKKTSLKELGEFKSLKDSGRNILLRQSALDFLPGADAVTTHLPASGERTPTLPPLGYSSNTSIESGNNSGSRSRLWELFHDETRDRVLTELGRLHLPPF